MFIYILRLDDNKYYVGKTKDLFRRFDEHRSGNGASWTRRHKPIFVERVIENASPFDEDKYVKEYMCKHGIANVRGGVYVTDRLTEQQIETLVTEIRGASDVCLRCGSADHFISNCRLKKSNVLEEILTAPLESPRGRSNPSSETPRRRAVSSSPPQKSLRARSTSLSNLTKSLNLTDLVGSNKTQAVESFKLKPPEIKRSRRPEFGKVPHQYIPLNGTIANTGTVNNLISTAIETSSRRKKLIVCERCKRNGHDSRFCFSKNYVNGNKITTPCGSLAETCFIPCRKCGRTGHPEAKCYK